METDKKLKVILKDILKVSDDIELISISNTHQWDSINHLNLVVAIEEEFNIQISPDDISKIYKDFKTVLDYIVEKLGE